MRGRLAFLVGLAALGAGLSGQVMAQPAAVPAVTDAPSALTAAAASITAALDGLRTSTGLKDIGYSLFAFFVVANAVYLLIKGYATGSGLSGLAADFVPLAVLAGVVQICLDRDVGKAVVDTIEVIGTKMTGAPFKDIGGLINEAAVVTFGSLTKMFDVGVSKFKTGGPLEMLQLVPAFLMKLVAMAVTAFFMMFALAVYLALLVTSQITVVIALILAPVFVPFLLFPPASFLFDGWLRFTIGAGLMKVIGMVMFLVTDKIMGSLATLSELAAVPGASTTGLEALAVDMVLYCTMILLSGLCAYLMMQVPQISTGLVSGSGGGAGFSGWGHLASRSPATRGVLGGMQIGHSAAPPGGTAQRGGSQQAVHSLSSAQGALPYAAKPVAAATGHALSAARGVLSASVHRSSAKAAGAGAVIFDPKASGFSARSESAYIKTHSVMNAVRSRLGKPPIDLNPGTKSTDARASWSD